MRSDTTIVVTMLIGYAGGFAAALFIVNEMRWLALASNLVAATLATLVFMYRRRND